MLKLARLAIACAAVSAAAPAFAEEGPYGIWIDHTGRGAVEISPCNGKVCGRIVWLQDKKNAQVCGMQVIGPRWADLDCIAAAEAIGIILHS